MDANTIWKNGEGSATPDYSPQRSSSRCTRSATASARTRSIRIRTTEGPAAPLMASSEMKIGV